MIQNVTSNKNTQQSKQLNLLPTTMSQLALYQTTMHCRMHTLPT